MNPFLKSPEDRLRIWKQFRKELTGKTELEQMQLVVSFWSKCPLSKYNFDWTDTSTWLTPWEMIYEGDICRNGVAYLMEQSLLVLGEPWTNERFKLVMLKDTKIEDQFFVVIIDDTYVLNYSLNEIVEFASIKDHCEFLEKYLPTEKGHVSY